MTPEEKQRLAQEATAFKAANPGADPEVVKAHLRSKLQSFRTAQPAEPNIERRALTVAQGLEQMPSRPYADAMVEDRKRLKPETLRRTNPKLKRTKEILRDVGKSKRVVERVLPEDSPYRDALKEAGAVAAEGAKSGLQGFLEAMSLPQQAVHQASEGTRDPDEWLRRRYKRADEGATAPLPDPIANLLRPETHVALADAAGKILDVPGSMLGAGLGIAADVAMLKRPNYQAAYEQVASEIKKPRAEGSKAIMLATSDPLSYIGGGGGAGTGATVGKQMGRALGRAGISGAKATKAVADATRAGEKLAGTPHLNKALEGIFKKAGAADPAQLQAVVGVGSEFAGRASPLSILGQEVNPAAIVSGLSGGKVQIPEQLARRAAAPIGKATRTLQRGVAGAAGRKGPVEAPYHERVFVEREAAKSTHRAQTGVSAGLDRYAREVASIAPASSARRRELMRHFADPGKSTPASLVPPNAAESTWLKKQNDFFAEYGQKLLDAGVIGKLERNPFSNAYVPRQELERGFRGWYKKRYGPTMGALETDPLHARSINNQRPLGAGARSGYRYIEDPHEIVANYVPRVERALETAKYKKVIARAMKDAPPEALARMDRAFAGSKWPILDEALSLFKEGQLLAIPRFHIVNVIEDTTKMAASGMNDPRRFLQADDVINAHVKGSDVVARSPGGRSFTADQLRAMGSENGFFDSPTAYDFSFDAAGKAPSVFSEAAEKAAGISKPKRLLNRAIQDPARVAGEAFRDATTLGARRLGQKFARGHDTRARMALFIDRLAKGDSPNAAAKVVSDTLFDMGVQSPFMRGAKRIAPFAPYTIRSAKALPRLIANRPGLVNLPGHIGRAYAGAESNDQRDEPPTFQSERSATLPLAKGARSKVGSLVAALSGQEVDPGFGMSIPLRGNLGEGLSPLLEAASGNADPLGLMLGPHLSWAAEQLAEKNLLTKQEQGPLDFGSGIPLFPYGTIGPPELQAPSEEDANLLQYLAPFAGQWPSFAANAIGAATGSERPLIGGYQRPYSDDARQRSAMDLLGKLTSLNPALTRATTEQTNAAQKPAVKRAAEVRAKRKAEIKERRKRLRLEKKSKP